MSKTRTTAVFFGVIALVALVIWNRPHSATERPPFDGIARGQMQLSMPDGGAVVSEFAIRRGSWSFTASWRFRTDMSWDEFQTWVSQRMSATYFGPDELDVKHIEFRRHRAGETHVLALKKVSEAGPLVVAGEFVGMRISRTWPMQESTRRARDSKPWAALRAMLGFGQMSGAALGLGLLLTTGASDLTLMVVIGTCLLMVISLALFRGQ